MRASRDVGPNQLGALATAAAHGGVPGRERATGYALLVPLVAVTRGHHGQSAHRRPLPRRSGGRQVGGEIGARLSKLATRVLLPSPLFGGLADCQVPRIGIQHTAPSPRWMRHKFSWSEQDADAGLA